MSDIVTEMVWSQSKSRRGSRLVMLALARMADEKGRATITLEEISHLTHLTTRSITKCLSELATLGELSRERGGGACNPNSYSILLLDRRHDTHEDSATELPATGPEKNQEGISLQETPSRILPEPGRSGKSLHPESEVSSSPPQGGITPVGSNTKKQASLLEHPGDIAPQQGPVTVPDSARELVEALTAAGMLVGWRLTEAEWKRVTALVDLWGYERLVDMVTRRWNTNRPPQSARYLLRIWTDLPVDVAATGRAGNVVALRRHSSNGIPFQNTANTNVYQNGF
jgi:hypothetical protein